MEDSAKREYLGTSTKPLYPFGWGLSYSTFKYQNLKVSPNAIGPEKAKPKLQLR
jgi:beta-glucosidase